MNRSSSRWWLGAIVGVALASCGRVPEPAPSGTPTSAAAPAPTTPSSPSSSSPSASAAAQEPELLADAEPARPDVVLAVEGSDEDGEAFRGWPWRVQALALRGEAPQELRIEGPAAMTAVRVKLAWLVPAAATAAAPAGTYTFVAGSARTQVHVGDAPAAPTPAAVARRRQLELWAATAAGDGKTARALADAWVASEPQSFAAHAALGDVLRAAGDCTGALAAYSDAVARVPAGMRPPAALHVHYGELLRELATENAVAPAPAPSTPTKPAADPAPTPSTAPSTPTPVAPTPADEVAAGPPGLVPVREHDEAKFLADRAGQWASDATAGSIYGPTYGPQKLTGAPDVAAAGDSFNAWCHAGTATGKEWVEAAFAAPVHATCLRVRQNNAPGAIVKVEAIEPDGTSHTWWEGADPDRAGAAARLQWFVLRVARTGYLVAKVRLTLDLDAVTGWKEIDAVQLVGTR